MSDSEQEGVSRREMLTGGWRRLLRRKAPAEEPPRRFDALIRPPGALPDPDFANVCDRSGACVDACPAQAILSLTLPNDPADGTPHIVPSIQACVVCEDLACMSVCPSGALSPVSAQSIRMGLAEVRHDVCLRTSGEDCRLCVDFCPIGADALEIGLDRRVVVHQSACVGCGVCEMQCPTQPRAIFVRPPRKTGSPA